MSRAVAATSSPRSRAAGGRPTQPGQAAVEIYAETYGQIVAALTSLLQACVEAGTADADADAEDVLRAMRGAWLVTDEQHRTDHAARLLDLLLDGLRFGALGPRPPG